MVFSCYSYYEDLKGFSNYMYKTAISKCAAVIFQTETQKKRFISKYKDNHLKYFKLFQSMNVLPPLKKVTEQYMPKLKRAKVQNPEHKIKQNANLFTKY